MIERQDQRDEVAEQYSIPKEDNNKLMMTPELIEDFFTYLQQKNRTPETIATYRSYLSRIYRYLPDDHIIVKGTLDAVWKQMESDGFSTNTINVSISAANSFLEYCGRRDLQLPRRIHESIPDQPELNRTEYQALLRTARRERKEQVYLLVKLFACVGISLNELENVTVEAVQAGEVIVRGEKGVSTAMSLPRCLREELENYIKRENIITGPIFVNRNGQPLNRATVSRLIASLADDSQVPREKCNPRTLQRLYHSTQESIEKSIFLQVQQMYEYLLEQEQLAVGWSTDTGSSQTS